MKDTNRESASTAGPLAKLTGQQLVTFWYQFEAWQLNATTDELEELQAALDNFTTNEVVSIVKVLRQALTDEQQRRQLPASLVQQLEGVSLLGARATG